MNDKDDEIQEIPLHEYSPTTPESYRQFIERQSPEFQKHISVISGEINTLLESGLEVLRKLIEESKGNPDE